MNKEHNQLRILFFDAAYPPPIVGGKEKQAHLLASEMKRQGIDVCALSFEHNGNQTQLHDDIKVFRVKKNLMAPLLFFLRLISLRIKFKILHIHTPSRIGHLMVLFGVILRYKVVFKFPGQELLHNLPPLAVFYWRITIRLAAILVVLEEKTEKTLVSTWSVNKNKIYRALNGVEVLNIKNYLTSEPLKLLFVGRLVKIKRCSDLIAACKNLDYENIDWQLDIVGDGPLSYSLQSIAKNLKIERRINFHGHQPDVVKFMYNADLLILPSETEGMSNVVLEAMAIGLPSICTDVGAARRMVGKYGKQYLVKPFDINGVSNKIKMFAKDPILLKEFGTYLHKRCKEKYSILTIANNYIELYKKIGKKEK